MPTFEWGAEKAQANYRKHGIGFETATEVSSPLAERQRPNVTTIRAKTRKTDGKLVRVHSDGREEELPSVPIREMADAEMEEAARSDTENPPLSASQLAKMRRVPRVKTLRRALHLTQEEFADRYHIPLGTLRDWEQGRSEPDQPARAYLKVIARDPEAVRRALRSAAE